MKKLPKIAFYCIGNFSEFHYYASQRFKFCNSLFYVQNFKGLEFFKSLDASNILYRYQYEEFNHQFEKIKIDEDLNYNVIWAADKSHYKMFSGRYTERIISTFASIFRRWIEKDKPDFIFFPIIESLDAMCLYEVARSIGVRTIVYSHFRILPYSLLSENKYEELPNIDMDEWQRILNAADSERVIVEVSRLSGSLQHIADQTRQTIDLIGKRNSEEPVFYPKQRNPLIRLIKNVEYKAGVERHNQILNLYIKLQVFFEDVLVPLQRLYFRMLEKSYFNRFLLGSDLKSYDFFALHFSPESSINTPAPYYIDQLRVVDKILLASKKPLVVREHPALYGKRSLAFYKALFSRPRVFYSSSKESIYERIAEADTIYTVTGTVALEAFFKDKKYKQFGRNFFSSFEEIILKYKVPLEINKKCLLVSLIFELGNEFIVLPHSNKRKGLNTALFSSTNIDSFGKALKSHIDRIKSPSEVI